MRRLINAITYIFILSALHSCNSDVFIEDIQPSESNIELSGNGDVATIHFESSDWEILAGKCSLTQAFFQIYNAAGVNVGQIGAPSLSGLGKLVLNDSQIDLTIERKHPKELTIKVDESIMRPRFNLSLLVGNEYESKEINISISQCDPYIFDDITYSLDAYSYSGNRVKDGKAIIVKNETSSPITTCLYPFSNACREVTFTSNSPEAFSLLEKSNFVVDIPTIVNKYLEMDGARALYTPAKQELPLSFANEEKKVNTPAHTTQRFTPLLTCDWFETDFTIRAHHPKTNKQRTIKGKLQSYTPKEFFIKQETITK